MIGTEAVGWGVASLFVIEKLIGALVRVAGKGNGHQPNLERCLQQQTDILEHIERTQDTILQELNRQGRALAVIMLRRCSNEVEDTENL